MSNRSTSKASDISPVKSGSTDSLKSSPLFGWLFAGGDLVAAKLDVAAGLVSKALDDTHETLNAMQMKGVEVESDLKRALNPATFIDNVQKLVTTNPLLSIFSGSQKRVQKEQQLALLSAKVDLLVEQVALLAAKEAAAKAANKSKTSTNTATKPAAKSTASKADSAKSVDATTKSTSTKTATTQRKATTRRTTSQKAPSKVAANKGTTRKSTSKTAATSTKASGSRGSTE
ncbi:hypothetical protein D210916BOD24_10160 [Alteromonas sp. D210916BOD_24]|uniref:hypothetical protein n=1 Tax=Alteromonas sp. D210916BOD_24 TaxID=3157618 RepID=UPI00399CC9CE